MSPRCSNVGRSCTTFSRLSGLLHASSRYITAISHTSIAGSYSCVTRSCKTQSVKFGASCSSRPRWCVAKRRVS